MSGLTQFRGVYGPPLDLVRSEATGPRRDAARRRRRHRLVRPDALHRPTWIARLRTNHVVVPNVNPPATRVQGSPSSMPPSLWDGALVARPRQQSYIARGARRPFTAITHTFSSSSASSVITQFCPGSDPTYPGVAKASLSCTVWGLGSGWRKPPN